MSNIVKIENKYGSCELDIPIEFRPIGESRGKDVDTVLLLTIDQAEQLRLVLADDPRFQFCTIYPNEGRQFMDWYVLYHDTPSMVCVVKLLNLEYKSKANPQDEIRRNLSIYHKS